MYMYMSIDACLLVAFSVDTDEKQSIAKLIVAFRTLRIFYFYNLIYEYFQVYNSFHWQI